MGLFLCSDPVGSSGRIGDWSDVDCQLELPVFEEQCGVTVQMPGDADELHCFLLFFTEEILNHIKSETNRYAADNIEKMQRTNKLKPNSLWVTWKPVTTGEMYKFFSIIIHMCLVKKPTISDYWSKDPVIASTFAPSLLSRDRFRSIFFMFHLNYDATDKPKGNVNDDPLHKIHPYLDHMVEMSRSLFKPFNSLTVDAAFLGR